ncbi:MAG: replicative DNA helicase [Pyrinomonadaceae bacterium]
MPLLEQPLPHSADAERAILGAVILDNPLLAPVAALLTPEDFYVRAYRLVLVAMLTLADIGSAINPLLLGEELKRQEQLEQVGGVAFISELTYGLPRFANLAPYIKAVRDKSLLRVLLHFANHVTSSALEADAVGADILTWIDEHAQAARAEYLGDSRQGIRTAADMLPVLQTRYEQFLRHVSDAVPTGFSDLDANLTGQGLGRGRLIPLAARPSLGKTTLGLDIVANAAAMGRRVLCFSLEMATEHLMDRLVAVEADVPRWKIQAGMSERDYRMALAALPDLCRLPVAFDDYSRAVADVRRVVREHARHHETAPDLVFVDYLQLVAAEGRRATRNDEVGSVSRALKGLAMECNVPVLAACQLSRDCERHNREPELYDLRDSGETEQDADVVLLLFGDKAAEGQTFRNVTVKCAKQRDGKLFRVEMPFNGELITFRSLRQIVGDE